MWGYGQTTGRRIIYLCTAHSLRAKMSSLATAAQNSRCPPCNSIWTGGDRWEHYHILWAQSSTIIFLTMSCLQNVTRYISVLYKSSPARSGGGIEVSGGSYARVPLVSGSTSWEYSVSSPGVQNKRKIQWANPTADWGTVTHVGIFGSATGSDMLFFGQLSAPITVKNGDGAVKIDPHALHINFGG